VEFIEAVTGQWPSPRIEEKKEARGSEMREGYQIRKYCPYYTSKHYFQRLYFVAHCLSSYVGNVFGLHSTVESRLSDIPFYPTCRVGTLHFINSHSEGLNSIETALAYVEQQREATATDVLLFRRWRDLAARKRKEAQKQIPITNFFKNKLFHLQIYIILNPIFVWEIFSVDAALCFLRNLITS
jgi:hypothetical protein